MIPEEANPVDHRRSRGLLAAVVSINSVETTALPTIGDQDHKAPAFREAQTEKVTIGSLQGLPGWGVRVAQGFGPSQRGADLICSTRAHLYYHLSRSAVGSAGLAAIILIVKITGAHRPLDPIGTTPRRPRVDHQTKVGALSIVG